MIFLDYFVEIAISMLLIFLVMGVREQVQKRIFVHIQHIVLVYYSLFFNVF